VWAERGAEPALARLAEALRAHDMGLLLDVVPNHMGIAQNRNAWWYDVLENGAASPFAAFFDIDWRPVKPELADRVLLPILGDQYGAVLDRGELTLELVDGRFRIRYYDTLLPVAPRSSVRILGHRLEELQRSLGAEHPDVLRLQGLITWFAALPPRTETDPDRVAVRLRDKEIGREKLLALLAESPVVRAFVEENVRIFNGTPGEPQSFDPLDTLLGDQPYRVAYWRVAGEEINYRRFFDINDLAAIRMEHPEVFGRAHDLIFRLVREGVVTGLRIDHPDGLYAPAEYFLRLQRGCARELGLAARPEDQPFYIVAEKIVSPGERLPEAWAVAGSTGYDFLNLLNGIFVDRTQARAMEQVYARLIKERPPFVEVVYECKRLVMETTMASELNVLGHRLNIISEKHRSSRDFTLRSLTQALREIIACFPVYRTYIGDGPGPVSEADREYLGRAVAAAKRRTPTMSPSVYDWIQDLLLLRFPPWADEDARRERRDFTMRFQQITGPVTAKGFEDTVLYRFNRLISLNEVGGDPSRFGTSIAEFHAENTARRRQWPHALSATGTHDTKRSEDVRARINVLSEIPAEWRKRVALWQRFNRRHRTAVDGRSTPGANTEYLIYQTLVGAWPITVDRLRAYMLKAIREAKSHTSWINPNTRYDEAIARFVEAILDPARSARFLEDFTAFQARIVQFGMVNGLAQTLVKITAPGVPDFYQGTELWDLSLVDPDNRRPVDWALRRRLLDELTAAEAGGDLTALVHELVKTKEDGRIKLHIVRQALAFRGRHRELFDVGDYRPIDGRGALAEHLCAFARVREPRCALTVVPRLLARRGVDDVPLGRGYWGDTWLEVAYPPRTAFRNVLTGERVMAAAHDGRTGLPVGDVLASLPVALLEREAA
jgi:(1->4)-alpha-D-glucan 1-alpha-D-glucosylmutase